MLRRDEVPLVSRDVVVGAVAGRSGVRAGAGRVDVVITGFVDRAAVDVAVAARDNVEDVAREVEAGVGLIADVTALTLGRDVNGRAAACDLAKGVGL